MCQVSSAHKTEHFKGFDRQLDRHPDKVDIWHFVSERHQINRLASVQLSKQQAPHDSLSEKVQKNLPRGRVGSSLGIEAWGKSSDWN